MSKENNLKLNSQPQGGDFCDRSLPYPELVHTPSTMEGMLESGEFFAALTENAQTIERCFSKDPNFADRLRLEEIEKAEALLRASPLFKGLSGEGEKQFLLKTAKEQILNPQVQSLPISNHEVYEIHRALFIESLKRDARDPETYKTRGVGIGLGLFISSVCPLAAVALFAGGSGYWIYDALRRRKEDARWVEEGQKTQDISLVFHGGRLWADGASSDVFDAGAAVTVVGMAKFLPKVVPARYFEPLQEWLGGKGLSIEAVELIKSPPKVILNPTPPLHSSILPKPLALSPNANSFSWSAQVFTSGAAVNSEIPISARPLPHFFQSIPRLLVGYETIGSISEETFLFSKPRPQLLPTLPFKVSGLFSKPNQENKELVEGPSQLRQEFLRMEAFNKRKSSKK